MTLHDEPSDFFISRKSFEPAYLKLHQTGELQWRAAEAIRSLEVCRACPRQCEVNRLEDKTATCMTGRYARVSSYFPHTGEEDCLRGTSGSGTIFFAWCNLRCVFCQNFDVSQEGVGVEVDALQLASIMLDLQAQGCHNINFVTPEHVVPQILEALVVAVENGLRLPIVYNTSAYDAIESLHWLDGVVDIYMPDFKIWNEAHALKFLKARDYPQVARNVIKEMHRQVGPLKMDEDGVARRGVLLRHLVIPGMLDNTRSVMQYIADEVSKDTYINIMAQYYPAGKVSSQKYGEINRRLHSEEYVQACQAALDAGLWRFDKRRRVMFMWQ
jgi:putative pyruvate formate lyase activating enzyme